MDNNLQIIYEQLRQLADAYRSQCLWFLDENYYPINSSQALRTIGYIERYGDKEAFIRVAPIKQWLLQHSNVQFVS